MLNELLAARGIPPNGLYPLDTVAAILGLTPRYLRRLIRQGHLQALRCRRTILGVTHAALDAFLASGVGSGGGA